MADRRHRPRNWPGRQHAAPDRIATALDLASVAVTVALALLVVLAVSGPLRVLLAVAFSVYVPGRAILANWPTGRARSQFALPILLSLSVVTGVAVLSLWLGAWSPDVGFALEAAGSVAGLLWALRQRSVATTASARRPTWPR